MGRAMTIAKPAATIMATMGATTIAMGADIAMVSAMAAMGTMIPTEGF